MQPDAVENMLLSAYMDEAEYSVSLGDTLDMKANIWLVVITFLATQTAYFLGRGLHGWAFAAQVGSALLLIVAGVLSLWELKPRYYILFMPSCGAIEKKIDKLRLEHRGSSDADAAVQSGIRAAQIEWAKQRTKANMAINDMKSALIDWSFRLAAIAAIANFVTLARFFKHPF